MDKYYYVDSKGVQAGPISPIEFKRFGINNDTLVWKQGMTNWTPAGHVLQLTPYLEVGKDGQKVLWRIAAVCGGLLIFLILLFFLVLMLTKCSNDITPSTEEDGVSIIVPDKDSLSFQRQLAEEAIFKARHDVTLAKEAIHRRLKTPGYSFKTTGDEEMDNYLRRQEREELERTERQLNSAIAGLLENYEKGYYTLVIQQTDAIASKRISLE